MRETHFWDNPLGLKYFVGNPLLFQSIASTKGAIDSTKGEFDEFASLCCSVFPKQKNGVTTGQ